MPKKNKIILFNPRSANSKYRIPNSILSVASSIEGRYDYIIVDGNLEKDPLEVITGYLDSGEFKYFGCTVMPGQQLKQAISITKILHENYPYLKTIWGGYFPSNHYKAVMNSGYVDFIINGQGEYAFPELVDSLENGSSFESIKNLIYKTGDKIKLNPKAPIPDPDLLPQLPYEKLNSFYPLDMYLGKTILGTKTAAYHSSYGCPFTCSFCAVVPVYEAQWKGKSAKNIYNDLMYLKTNFCVNAVEFHDNNFFVSEKRVKDFSRLMKNENMNWWGEARIDTVDKFSDETLYEMRNAGCTMIFFGAETGNDEILKKMNKGGKQTGEQIKKFAGRISEFDIIPEYSFVMGSPAESVEKIWQQIDNDIEFIKEIKEINPETEIIIYIYSPVPTLGSELFSSAEKYGFTFPDRLEDWLNPKWENFDLRKNPLTPWLNEKMIMKIQNFETVLNAYYPTLSDIKLTSFQRYSIKKISSFRYKQNLFMHPYELKFLQSKWLKYRQPEVEGF
jgi:anaerobic magnesium-protoporphyrin IX monomethyl ester cyclase